MNPELLLGGKYGHHLHVWNMKKRRTSRRSTSGRSSRWCSSCGPRTTRPSRRGFVGVVVSTADLSAACGSGSAEDGNGKSAPEGDQDPRRAGRDRAAAAALQPFGAVPPLVTDISLSVDDKTLLVSCWGTGELKRYDVPTRSTR